MVLEAELAPVRSEYNPVRRHEGIGYVMPHDEHEGRGRGRPPGPPVDLERTRDERLAYHRRTTTNLRKPRDLVPYRRSPR